jgi:hypothetical protein
METLTLKQRILNKIDDSPRGFADELASISGTYSSGSNLKKVLRDPKKEFEKFNGLINIVRHIWGNESSKMMAKYSEEIHPNKNTARNLLECLSTSREFEAFNNLLDRMDNCTNVESKEWAKIYRLQYKYELAKSCTEFNEVLKEIREIKVNSFELKIYKNLLLNYCFNLLKNYDSTKFLTKEIEQDIELIENGYIKDMYLIRLNEVKSYTNLKVYNNPVAARECADKIISSNARTAFKAYAYFIKGLSYLFTSYDNTVNYLNESIKLYESINRQHDIKEIKEEVEFAKVYWDKFENEKCLYIKSYLLYNVKKGKDISNELTKANIEPEFKLYLEGLSAKSNKKLMLSLIKFIKKNDMFLANLAKIELFNNGIDEDDKEIIEELTNTNA